MEVTMNKIHQPQISHTTLKDDLRGLELGEEVKIWQEVASSEARLTLMKNMIKQDLAFADLEEFGLEFTNKLKSINTKNKTMYRRVSKPAMRAKLADEQIWRRDLGRVKAKLRKDLVEKLEGEKSRRFKRVINHLNKLASEKKKRLNEKYKTKITHLKQKYHSDVTDSEEKVPTDLTEYSELSIFSRAKFDEIEVPQLDIKTIGDIELSEDEINLLKLHNKFSILEDLKPNSINTEIEASIAKLRMEKEKDKIYEDFTPEERAVDEELEARNRMIFDPTDKIYDSRKRRVTDINQCSRVTLPKPLSADEESRLEVRKRTQKEAFENFRNKNTNRRGEQTSNLTTSEKTGLKSLQKRIKEEEIIVMKTDKSGRFIVTSPAKYIEMGGEHTKKDTEIEWQKVREMEKIVNQHTVAWELMWRSGEDHNHQERIVRSRATRSGNQANLTLLYKDHKPGDKTRPVASGNESFNQGLSNGISEVMESVARAIKSPYSVISSEDLLARIHQFNKKIVQPDPSDPVAEGGGDEQDPPGGVPSDITVPSDGSRSPTPPPEGQEDDTAGQGGEQDPPCSVPSDITVPSDGNRSLTPPPEGHKEDTAGQVGEQDPPSSARQDNKLSLVGSDVVALFPSITAVRTAKIVREKIEQSEIDFEGFDLKRGRAYLAINKKEIEPAQLERLKLFLPNRKAKTGTPPTMSSIGSKWDPEEQWVFQEIKITEADKKMIIGAVHFFFL